MVKTERQIMKAIGQKVFFDVYNEFNMYHPDLDTKTAAQLGNAAERAAKNAIAEALRKHNPRQR